jgi:hypothetical protein
MEGNTVFYHNMTKSYAKDKRLTFVAVLPKEMNYENFSKNFGFHPNEDTNIYLVMGVAVCHPKDQFCKAKGRQVALDRAMPCRVTVDTVSFDYSSTKAPITIFCNTEIEGKKIKFSIVITKHYTTLGYCHLSSY